MQPEKIIVKLPWAQIARLIATLVKSARGGISKAEGEELLEQLADLLAALAAGLAVK
jgi:hypothetical protein